MKRTFKKNVIYSFAALGVGAMLTVASCKKNDSEITAVIQEKTGQLSVADFVSDLQKIGKLGFDPLSVRIVPSGYLVEGDIILTRSNLDQNFTDLPKKKGQYSSRYKVSVNAVTRTRILKVAYYDPTNNTKFRQAFDLCLAELNSLKTSLNFVFERDSTRADIITQFTALSSNSTLGEASFVDSNGNPGRYIWLKSEDRLDSSVETIKAIMCHEFGHALGLRHTDYKNRLYSIVTTNGGTYSEESEDIALTALARDYVNNETPYEWENLPQSEMESVKNQLSVIAVDEGDRDGTIAQASHIYGTPLSPTYGGIETTDPSSLMLSNAGPFMNLKFSLYDNIAFLGLYGNMAQTDLIKKSLGEFGDVTVTGKTLQQVVNEVKILK